MSFNDKVVIVTGGSSGIGAAIAIDFSAAGAKVCITGRDKKKLDNIAKKCKNPLAILADITVENDLKRIVDETVKHFGKLDILINNAGMGLPASILSDNAMEVYDTVMNTNLRSTVYLTHLAAPHLIKTKGNIINISSICGQTVMGTNTFAYNVSKAAVDHFTRSVASELASSGVRVNSVNPGPVMSDGFEAVSQIMTDKGITFKQHLTQQTALKRLSETKEIADLVLFLASEKAKGITGSLFVADNGFLVNTD
ncbi:uncharacterized protein LOC113505885 [Trichoplusia ni]|uniref:Uncharacterized protein LOC113505885 n=1 Tax=Trichoplusia ni TaxID=7111 RepID=A0A7E5WVI4_TRINI|nr:uncharacterized protein LOC113505885 [Trichoplusia ni]